jgi:DNA-binding transcriptional LysR family regulator
MYAAARTLDPVNVFRDKPAGTLRLNVPLSAARLVLPAIVPAFLSAYPDIRKAAMASGRANC